MGHDKTKSILTYKIQLDMANKKYLISYILKKGKKQDIFNWNLANQEGNENLKMYEIENLA